MLKNQKNLYLCSSKQTWEQKRRAKSAKKVSVHEFLGRLNPKNLAIFGIII